MIHMFSKMLKMQISSILRKKEAVLTFFIVMTFMFVNFYHNMYSNYIIKNVSQMQNWVKNLTLSDWTTSGYFLVDFLPLLVVMPTACSYIVDRDTRIKLYIESRGSKKSYWYSKLIAVFCSTFLIFTIPFLLETMLSLICFDLNSNGDPSMFGYYQTIENDGNYELARLFVTNKVLYAIVMIFIFGIVCGIFAMFNFSITTFTVFKFRIFTFFPIYILLYAITFIQRIVKPDFTMNYILILRMFGTANKNYAIYNAFLCMLVILSFLIIRLKIRRDEIL